MLPKAVKRHWLAAAGTTSVAAVIVATTLILGRASVGDLVEVNLRERTHLLADFLLEDPATLNALLTGLTRDPDVETRAVQVATAAGMPNFAIYDAGGRQAFVPRSMRYSWLMRERPGGTVVGDRVGGALLAREGQWASVVTGDDGVSTVVMPLQRDGVRVAFLSASADLGKMKVDFSRIIISAIGLFLIVVAATIGVPFAIYMRRKKRIEQADEQINFLANYDPLTHLLNRKRIQEETDRILATSRATRETLALWQLDIEGLGEINNMHGQEIGDALLRHLASLLIGIVDRTDLVARIGADDFVILQRRVTNTCALEGLAKSIARTLQAPIEIEGHLLRPRICMGVALTPEHGRTFTQLARHAELAVMVHKTSQQSDFILFDATIDEEAHKRREIENRMRQALEAGTFELFYQPIVASLDHQPVGFEALIRLPDGQGGYISPAAFIPIAETRGYIKQIGDWVIREAARQIAEWPEHLTVSVNLSAVQFRDGDLVETVANALRSAGIEGHRLEIEVVESLLLDRSDAILSQLQGLKSLGVSIAMDDFGTGYSSLGYLWRFPFDKLKIDQSFMTALEHDEAKVPHILRTIISLAHHMRMRVTTEGIETREQVELLATLGTDLMQGYHFGKPMPADRVAAEILASAASRNRPGAAGQRQLMVNQY